MVCDLIFCSFTVFLLGLLKYSCGSLRDQTVQLVAYPTQRLIASPQQLMSVRPPTEFCPDNTRSNRQHVHQCTEPVETLGEKDFEIHNHSTRDIRKLKRVQISLVFLIQDCFCQCWCLSINIFQYVIPALQEGSTSWHMF